MLRIANTLRAPALLFLTCTHSPSIFSLFCPTYSHLSVSGIHLRDLTYFDDGLKNESRLINLKNMSGTLILSQGRACHFLGMGDVLAQFRGYQSTGYLWDTAELREIEKLKDYLLYAYYQCHQVRPKR